MFYQTVDGPLPALSGPSFMPSAAEQAFELHFTADWDAGTALVFDLDRMPPEFANEPRAARYTTILGEYNRDNISTLIKGTPTMREPGFALFDRVMNRPFVAGYAASMFDERYPGLLLDPDDGRPWALFGADRNLLQTTNGCLRPKSRLNAAGAELWDLPLLTPGGAWSGYLDGMFPALNSTIYMRPGPGLPAAPITFPEITGGGVIAGASPTFNNNMITFVSTSDGFWRIRNRNDTGGYIGNVNYLDNTRHRWRFGWSNNVFKLFCDGVDKASTSFTNWNVGIKSGDFQALQITLAAMGRAFPFGNRGTYLMRAQGLRADDAWISDATKIAQLDAYLDEACGELP